MDGAKQLGQVLGEDGFGYIKASSSFIDIFFRVRYVTSPNDLIPMPPMVTGEKIEDGGVFTQDFNVGVSRKNMF